MARVKSPIWGNKVGYKNKNDIYRPTNRITKGTPITHKELTKKEIKTARTKKYRKGRVKRFRTKKGGAWTQKNRRDIE
jgi:hypothetical protein